MVMKLLASNRWRSYLQVWWITATNAVQATFVNRWSNLLFILGKSLRFLMTLLFLFLLKERDISLGAYNSSQVIIFYLTYMLVDTTAQVFYRGVYTFGHKIRTGEFDFYLIRPMSALFRALTGQPDINDVVFMIPTIGTMVWLLSVLNIEVSFGSVLLYLALLLNSFLLATALHILVLVAGILTTEVDNIIWTYRDLSRLAQFPVSMYVQPLRSMLFFVLPIGLMMTVPTQALLMLPTSVSIGLTFAVGIGFFWVSLRAWNWALKQYSSASS